MFGGWTLVVDWTLDIRVRSSVYPNPFVGSPLKLIAIYLKNIIQLCIPLYLEFYGFIGRGKFTSKFGYRLVSVFLFVTGQLYFVLNLKFECLRQRVTPNMCETYANLNMGITLRVFLVSKK